MTSLAVRAPRSAQERRRRSAFTLIEVLVVVVIIAVLASIVAPNVFRHVDTAKSVTAKAQIAMLGSALDAYRLDNGRYPTTEQGLAAVDPWGAGFVYRNPGEHLPTGFDLSSMGADGAVGGTGDAADVTSWKQ